MTLIVSMIITEGIVIAGDSLATTMAQVSIESENDFKCPKCSYISKIKSVGGVQFPSTTLSFAQKVFPFLGSYGVGAYGLGTMVNKTIYYAMMELEKEIESEKDDIVPNDNMANVVDKIGNRAIELLHKQFLDWKEKEDNWLPLGFHIVGYEKSNPKVFELHIGKTIKMKQHGNINVYVAGQTQIAQSIFELYRKGEQATIGLFSLQDAIDYSEFLISTTAKYQRFSATMPNVGGEIDIGLVTPFHGFRWIQQKRLGKILGGEIHG